MMACKRRKALFVLYPATSCSRGLIIQERPVHMLCHCIFGPFLRSASLDSTTGFLVMDGCQDLEETIPCLLSAPSQCTLKNSSRTHHRSSNSPPFSKFLP